LKETTQLKKELGPKALVHSQGTVGDLQAAVQKVRDTLDRYKLSNVAASNLQLGYKGIVQLKISKPAVVPPPVKKPVLNTSDLPELY
jgi:hypothetical protein